ncbi:MAG: glycoside hydrolase [Verrucomicrobia bacterium]|nr:glycoside hydrolase [Verrucomicrobiota bacterium]
MKPCRSAFRTALLLMTALGPVPATTRAADPPKPAVKVTQELLNSIHVPPQLIFNPMPAYGQKYLPFAMAASMESTSKGRLWTCWAGGQDGPNAYLLASYSDDQGKSWRDPVFVIDPQAHGLKMGTRLGSFWCDPKGRLWLFFHQSCGMFDGSCSNWYVRCDDPDAEKPLWTQPVYIGFGASLNKPIVRQNGEWILPVSLWERWHIDKPFADCYHELDAVRGANVFVSDDEGGHWRYRGGIIYQDSCFNEHTVAELNDGRLWMLSRGMKATFQSFSTDGGKTWQPQSTAFPHVNSKAVIRRLQSGHLLIIRHGREITKATAKRKELTAFLTSDEGKSWSGKLLLDERNDVSYPDIAQAPNGDIYVHYDRERTGAAEILFARFREEDVQAGKLVSKDAALKNLVKSRAQGMSRGVAALQKAPEAKVAKVREDLPLMLVPPRVREFNDPKLLEGRQHVAYPGIARTLRGRLWVCWGAGEDGPGGYSMLASSDDEGRTWTGPRYLLKEPPTPNGFPRSVNGTYLWTDPQGRLWWFFPYSLGIFDGRSGIWAAVCENPDADKLTWGIPRRLADGEYVNKPVILRDGGWLLSATLFPRKCIGILMGDMKESDLFRELDPLRMSNCFVSKDQGTTWERRGGVTAPPEAWDWDEPHFIEKTSGELRCLLRTNYGLCESRSTDGARTWSTPEPSKLVHPASRLFMMKLQSGKVLLVKHGRLKEKTGRTHLTAYLSDDEGETWQGGLLLDERPCSYPDGIQSPDGRIQIVYDQERLNGRIVMATLREEDVRAGKLISRDASLKTPVYQAPSGPTPADRSR